MQEIQRALQNQQLDGWLLYDFRKSNAHAISLLKIPSETLLTRRFFYWIPKTGEPIKVVSAVENPLKHLPGIEKKYSSWKELHAILNSFLKGKIAMEYSPMGKIPEISCVDAGTIDLVRSFGCEVYSSGDLLQAATSLLSEEGLQTHLEAADALDQIAAETWKWIAEHYKQGITEWDVQQEMLKGMKKRGMVTDHPPICAVNAHSADPHFSPEKGGEAIKEGDFILIDLWCKKASPRSIYGDITRVAVLGEPSEEQKRVFEVVKAAQDAVLGHLRKESSVRGCDLDAISRKVIEKAGYGAYFVHRLGHNIHEKDHGPGAHLDSLETQDERKILPGTCFSVEPGIYLPGKFGVRLEFDIYLQPDGKALLTGGKQDVLINLKSDRVN